MFSKYYNSFPKTYFVFKNYVKCEVRSEINLNLIFDFKDLISNYYLKVIPFRTQKIKDQTHETSTHKVLFGYSNAWITLLLFAIKYFNNEYI